MHFITFETESEVVAFGPFDDELEATTWFFPWAEHLDSRPVHVINGALAEPFDMRSPELATLFDDLTPVPPHARVQAVHTGQTADEHARAYAVQVLDDHSHVGGLIGPFASRDQAEHWWDAQAEFIDGADVHILPLLPPPPAPDRR